MPHQYITKDHERCHSVDVCAVFGVFVVVVLPKLKVDPEEETAASAEGQSSEQLPAQQPRERLTSRGSHKRRD